MPTSNGCELLCQSLLTTLVILIKINYNPSIKFLHFFFIISIKFLHKWMFKYVHVTDNLFSNYLQQLGSFSVTLCCLLLYFLFSAFSPPWSFEFLEHYSIFISSMKSFISCSQENGQPQPQCQSFKSETKASKILKYDAHLYNTIFHIWAPWNETQQTIESWIIP